MDCIKKVYENENEIGRLSMSKQKRAGCPLVVKLDKVVVNVPVAVIVTKRK